MAKRQFVSNHELVFVLNCFSNFKLIILSAILGFQISVRRHVYFCKGCWELMTSFRGWTFLRYSIGVYLEL